MSFANLVWTVYPKVDFIFPLIVSQKLGKEGLKKTCKSPLVELKVEGGYMFVFKVAGHDKSKQT